nr:unnamed protein product [Digitaria exilis]
MGCPTRRTRTDPPEKSPTQPDPIIARKNPTQPGPTRKFTLKTRNPTQPDLTRPKPDPAPAFFLVAEQVASALFWLTDCLPACLVSACSPDFEASNPGPWRRLELSNHPHYWRSLNYHESVPSRATPRHGVASHWLWRRFLPPHNVALAVVTVAWRDCSVARILGSRMQLTKSLDQLRRSPFLLAQLLLSFLRAQSRRGALQRCRWLVYAKRKTGGLDVDGEPLKIVSSSAFSSCREAMALRPPVSKRTYLPNPAPPPSPPASQPTTRVFYFEPDVRTAGQRRSV